MVKRSAPTIDPQWAVLLVGQSKASATQLLLHDLVLLDQVLDHFLLTPIDPARESQEQPLQRVDV